MKLNLSNETIQSLKQQNFRCKVFHYRNVRQDDGSILKNVPIKDIKDGTKICGFGGMTEIYISTPDNKEYKGVARCNDKDSFCYAISRKICLGRLQSVE